MASLLYYALFFATLILAMWLTSKALKFKKQGLMPALLLAFVYTAISYAISYVMGTIDAFLESSYSLSRISPEIYGLAFFAMSVVAWVLSIKFFYREGWAKTIAAFVITWIVMTIIIMILGVLFWQAGAFGP